MISLLSIIAYFVLIILTDLGIDILKKLTRFSKLLLYCFLLLLSFLVFIDVYDENVETTTLEPLDGYDVHYLIKLNDDNSYTVVFKIPQEDGYSILSKRYVIFKEKSDPNYTVSRITRRSSLWWLLDPMSVFTDYEYFIITKDKNTKFKLVY